MTLTTDRQQFAEQNEMSIDFVNWFFDKKKEGCGNAWFIMAAAMWEGWKGRANREAQPVAWEMRYWNSGHNMWGDWERITAEQHAEMSVQHAADNDYEFRVLYDAPPATAAVKLPTEFYSDEGIVVRLEQVMAALSLVGVKYERRGDACRAAMLKGEKS